MPPTHWKARLREEPFRLFFPLAFALGAAGVSHWILFSTGALGRYLSVFHATTQTQAFLPAFAAGFLLTAIPKRTRSAPATIAEIAILAGLLVAIPVASLLDAVWLAEIGAAASLVVLAQFAVRRFFGAAGARRPPASFALVPIAMLSGIGGSILFALFTRAAAPVWMLAVGRALVFEGVFTCLVLGVGGLFLPLALRGEGPPDVTAAAWSRTALWALAGIGVVAGLTLQARGFVRIGSALRGGLALAALASSGALRRPSRSGWNRKLVHASALALPLGLLLAAAFPAHRVALMHVTYVGGFGTLAFAVATHVTLGHGGFSALQSGRPAIVAAFGALFLVATALRAIATAVPVDYAAILGWAAAAWLLAAILWAVFLVPKMWSRPIAAETP